MADAKIIAASLSVNSDEAVKEVLRLKGTVAELKKEFANAKAGSDEQLAALKKLTTAEQDLAKAQDQLSGSNKESAGSFGKIKGALNELPGATGAASKGVSALNAGFKALLANPIVLIIAAIVLALKKLYDIFKSTDEGAQKLQSVFDGIGAAMRELTQRVLGLAGAIVKFFKGDFKGAMEDGKKAVTGFGDAMVDAFQRGREASDLLDEVADAARVLEIQYAAMNARLAKSKEILTDETATFKEKTAALKASGEEIDKYYKRKAENDEKELNAIAKKYNIEEQLLELRRVGFEQGAENFDNFLQQLTIGADGLKEIEDAIKKSIESGEEFSAKQRQQNKAEATLQRQEEARLREERQKAAEAEKARRQNLLEFTNKLTKLQQDNTLALIKDGYERELKALDFRIAEEKRLNQQAFKDKKINQEQLNKLNTELDNQFNIQRDAITKKHNEEVKKTEAAFQKELAEITSKTRLSAIKDNRQLELTELEIGYQEKLAQAIERYKEDATKLAQITAAIDEQYRAEKAAREEKFREEDAKKKLEKDIAAQEKIIEAQNADFEAKRLAVDQEQELFQRAFDNKLITEDEYNKQVEGLAEKRKKIAELETAHRKAQSEEAAGTLEKLSNLIGKKTIAGKLLGIAAATINTFQGASEALKQPSTLPSPLDVIAKIANVATVIATGLKTVQAITAVNVPGGGSGGQSVTAPSLTTPSAPLAPVQTSTSLDQNTINNIGNAAAGGVNAVRAYVVEQDNAEAAKRAQRLAGVSVLGG